jgi:hypothetical protein
MEASWQETKTIRSQAIEDTYRLVEGEAVRSHKDCQHREPMIVFVSWVTRKKRYDEASVAGPGAYTYLAEVREKNIKRTRPKRTMPSSHGPPDVTEIPAENDPWKVEGSCVIIRGPPVLTRRKPTKFLDDVLTQTPPFSCRRRYQE